MYSEALADMQENIIVLSSLTFSENRINSLCFVYIFIESLKELANISLTCEPSLISVLICVTSFPSLLAFVVMVQLPLNALDVFHAMGLLVGLVKFALAILIKHEKAFSINVDAFVCRDVRPEAAMNNGNFAVLLENPRDVDILHLLLLSSRPCALA